MKNGRRRIRKNISMQGRQSLDESAINVGMQLCVNEVFEMFGKILFKG